MKFGKRQEGATLTEYGLLLGLIAIVVIGAMTVLGKNVSTMFKAVAESI